MKKLILVPLKRYDQVEDFMPYITEVARPDTKAVFMVPYPVDGFRWSRADGGLKAIEEGMRLADYYNWDTNLTKAKTRLGPAMAALLKTPSKAARHPATEHATMGAQLAGGPHV